MDQESESNHSNYIIWTLSRRFRLNILTFAFLCARKEGLKVKVMYLDALKSMERSNWYLINQWSGFESFKIHAMDHEPSILIKYIELAVLGSKRKVCRTSKVPQILLKTIGMRQGMSNSQVKWIKIIWNSYYWPWAVDSTIYTNFSFFGPQNKVQGSTEVPRFTEIT